jgi:hypothetical protein
MTSWNTSHVGSEERKDEMRLVRVVDCANTYKK